MIKESIQQGRIMKINVYTTNVRVLIFVKLILMHLKERY